MTAAGELHPSHDPEPDGMWLYPGSHMCMRCCRFIAHDRGGYRVTEAGERPCVPGYIALRNSELKEH